MSIPLDHHFIPAFFLSQWTDVNEKLVEYTIKHDKLIPKPIGPRGTGFQPHLYSFSELPPDEAQFIEKVFFNFADRVAADALANHITKTPTPWTVDLVSAWSRFVIALHLRHPDAMPGLRVAVKSIWNGSGAAYQADYEAIKKPEDPPTFDEYLAARDPLAPSKMHVNMIVKAFDNEYLGKHVNNMMWGVIDVSASRHRFLLSDRPVLMADLKELFGIIALPIGPTKLFIATNNDAGMRHLRSLPARELVHKLNTYVVGRARKFVWAHDQSQTAFIEKHMSKRMEPTPLFPNIGYYPGQKTLSTADPSAHE
jgi:Protein of unknown function (DUF4238)